MDAFPSQNLKEEMDAQMTDEPKQKDSILTDQLKARSHLALW